MLHFAAEKNQIASCLGWAEGYEQAIYDLYVEHELSYAHIGAIFRVTTAAIRLRLAKINGFKSRRQGGANRWRKIDFRIF